MKRVASVNAGYNEAAPRKGRPAPFARWRHGFDSHPSFKKSNLTDNNYGSIYG